MAVTKIRKISSWTMLAITLISLSIFALFFFGGVGEPLGANGDQKNPIYTGELLIWAYILLALCVTGLILFGIFQFGSKFKSNPKAALMGLSVLVAFAVLLLIAYLLSDGTLLTTHLNQESEKYNTVFWLKTTDTWLYSMYILLGLCIFAMGWGSVKKILSK